MKNILLIMILILQVPFLTIAQNLRKQAPNDTISIYNDTILTKVLLDSTALKRKDKIVVLKETNSLLIFTTAKFLSMYMQPWLNKESTGTTWDLVTQMKILHALTCKKTNEKKHAYNISKNEDVQSAVEIIMPDLLELGQCLIYNKIARKLEKNISIKWHLHMLGKTIKDGAAEERIYYINGVAFLKTVDGVYN